MTFRIALTGQVSTDPPHVTVSGCRDTYLGNRRARRYTVQVPSASGCIQFRIKSQRGLHLTDEQLALRDLAADVARTRFAPHALAWDRASSPLPNAERSALAALDLLGITLPEEHGGSGRPLIDALIVIEEVAKISQLAAFPIFEASTGPARVIDLFGTAEQKTAFLPRVVRGEVTIAAAISEPEAGSAATDLATTISADGNEVIVRGVKRWSSGAGHAEQYLVYGRLNESPGSKGIGAVLVDRDADGVSFGAQERMMGFHGIPSADMFLDAVRVPTRNVIVSEGGFAPSLQRVLHRASRQHHDVACDLPGRA